MKAPVLIDARNLLDADAVRRAGFSYIGWAGRAEATNRMTRSVVTCAASE